MYYVIILHKAMFMIYLKREIDGFLANWKNNGPKRPLIVKGPDK